MMQLPDTCPWCAADFNAGVGIKTSNPLRCGACLRPLSYVPRGPGEPRAFTEAELEIGRSLLAAQFTPTAEERDAVLWLRQCVNNDREPRDQVLLSMLIRANVVLP